MIAIEDLIFSSQDFSLHVNLSLERNRLGVIMGPSGCGKSTLLKLLCGILKPFSGNVLFNGQNLLSIPMEKRNIGMIFQDLALFPHMSVRQNILFPMNIRKKSTAAKNKKLDELCELLKLHDLRKRNVRDLSGGEQQRTAIARTLASDPKILLLDEPYSSLDAVLREELRQNLKLLQKELQIPVLFVTHDRQEAFSLADVLFIMKDGRIIDSGTPSDIYEKPADLFTAEFTGILNRLPASLFQNHPLLYDTIYFRPDAILSLQPDETFLKFDALLLSQEDLGTHKLIHYRCDTNTVTRSCTDRSASFPEATILYIPLSKCIDFSMHL